MKIILVNGQGGVGKSQFCWYARKNRGLVYEYSTIDEVKRLAELLGWDGKKDARGRRFLSDLKMALSKYNGLPSTYIIEQITRKLLILNTNNILCAHDAIFFVHMREPEEINKWKNLYGAKALLIRRKVTEQTWGNKADDGVFDCDYDYVIDNNRSLEELERKAIYFVDGIRQEQWSSHL